MDKFNKVPTKSIVARVDLEDNGDLTLECKCNFKDDKLQIVLMYELVNSLADELKREVDHVEAEDKQSKK